MKNKITKYSILMIVVFVSLSILSLFFANGKVEGQTCTKILPGSPTNCDANTYCLGYIHFNCEEGGSVSESYETDGYICAPPTDEFDPVEYRWDYDDSCECEQKMESFRCDDATEIDDYDISEYWSVVDESNCALLLNYGSSCGGSGGDPSLIVEDETSFSCETGEVILGWENLWDISSNPYDYYAYDIEMSGPGGSIIDASKDYTSSSWEGTFNDGTKYQDGVGSPIIISYDLSEIDPNFDSDNYELSIDITALGFDYDGTTFNFENFFNIIEWNQYDPPTVPPNVVSWTGGTEYETDFRYFQCGPGTEVGDCTEGYDECGVCGGDNSTCTDCAGVVNGTSTVDVCGVCGGDNSTCTDVDCTAGVMTITWDNYEQTGLSRDDGSVFRNYWGPKSDPLGGGGTIEETYTWEWTSDIGDERWTDFLYSVDITNNDTGWYLPGFYAQEPSIGRTYSDSKNGGTGVITDNTISVSYDLPSMDDTYGSSGSSYTVEVMLAAFDSSIFPHGIDVPNTYPPEPDEYGSGGPLPLRIDTTSINCPAVDTDCAGVVNGTSTVDVCGECTTEPETDPLQCNPGFTLTVEAGSCDSDEMFLSWSGIDGSPDQYVIQRDGVQIATTSPEAIDFLDSLTFGDTADPEFAPGKSYTYTVYPTYTDGDGNTNNGTSSSATENAPEESDVCGVCGGGVTDSLQCNPGFTINSAIDCSTDTINLNWIAADGNVEGYYVERDSVHIGNGTSTQTSFPDEDPNLVEGQEYIYTVTPYYVGGMGSSATTSTTLICNDISITNLDVGSCNSTTIDITWNDVDGEEGYLVYRDGNQIEGPTSQNITSYTDDFTDGFDTFSSNTSYDYVVAYFTLEDTYYSATSTVTSADVCPETGTENCGSMHGTNQTYKPSSNLCSAGTESAVTANSSTRDWEWTCTDGSTVSSCSANILASCGDADKTPTDTKPTIDLCDPGNSTSTAVSTNSDKTLWAWECKNDDASYAGVSVVDTCSAENTNGVFIKDFNLNPRIVQNPTDECTAYYTIVTSNSAATTCQLSDTSGVIGSIPFVSGVENSTSTGIYPGKSYKISCVFDDGVDNIQKETEYRSCNINPTFEEF